MKGLKFKVSYALCLVLVAFYGVGCKHVQNYKATYTAKVIYTDSSIDTISFSYDSFKGNNVYHYLKTTDSGVFASGGTSPCLVVGCGLHTRTIACGVRRYEILNMEKEAINCN